MRAISVSFLLLFLLTTASALSAQAIQPSQPSQLQTSPATPRLIAPPGIGSMGCPVSFSLERNDRGAVGPVLVLGQSHASQAKRSVQVSLRSQEGKSIAAADITLYAPRISSNATPARVIYGQTDESKLVAKTYHVEQGKFTDGLLTGSLDLLDTMAGVERAEVKNVRYADGTTWHAVDGVTCVAVPQNFILVARP